jgi:hypothetical protein
LVWLKEKINLRVGKYWDIDLSIKCNNLSGRAIKFFEKMGWQMIDEEVGLNPMGKQFKNPICYMEKSIL